MKIEAELEKVTGKTDEEIKRGQQAILDRYLGAKKPQAGRFADPALFFKAQAGG